MTVDDDLSALRAKLVKDYGERGAAILMDRPPGGWNDLVTHASLHRELDALEGRIDLKLEALESRIDGKFVALEARFDAKFDARFSGIDARFIAVDARFDAIDHRFDVVDGRFDLVDHRFDRFEHQLLAQVDRRLRQQSWVTMSTVIAAMGIIVTALKV